jgi:hypothetical protein
MWESNGVASFPGKTVMILAAICALVPDPTTAGIAAKAFGLSGSRMTVRSGTRLLPAVSDRKAPSIASIHSAMGR